MIPVFIWTDLESWMLIGCHSLNGVNFSICNTNIAWCKIVDVILAEFAEHSFAFSSSVLLQNNSTRCQMLEERFPCPNNCGRSYLKKFTLTRHLKYECNREKQFKCRLCFREFAHKADMRTHMGIVHKMILWKGLQFQPLFFIVCKIGFLMYLRTE